VLGIRRKVIGERVAAITSQHHMEGMR